MSFLKGITPLVMAFLYLLIPTLLSAQNCIESQATSFVDDCGNCVLEIDDYKNNCADFDNVCPGDTLNIYLQNSLAFSTSDSLPEIIRSQIEADFCADGGNIIDCYCTLLPELESFLLEHSFLQDGVEGNAQLLDLINFEGEYLRLFIHIDSLANTGELIYEIELEREIIMNCFLCNDQVCIDQNIGIPLLEKIEIPITITNNCLENQDITSHTTNFDENSLHLFPNPVSETLFLDTKEFQNQVTIFDVNGKLVSKNNNVTKIEVGHLKAGLYLIQLKSPSQILRSQFMKL